MIVLETPRLTLRQLTPDDLPAVTALYSDPVVMATKGGVRSPEETAEMFQGYLRDYATVGYCFWAVIHRVDDRFIGLCGLLNQPDVDGQAEVEVGYTFDKAYWGQGLATEAAQACKEYGFRVLGRTHLISIIAPDNIRSQRVALRNGMRHERDFINKGGDTRRIYSVAIAGGA